jgi:hypothetical protein
MIGKLWVLAGLGTYMVAMTGGTLNALDGDIAELFGVVPLVPYLITSIVMIRSMIAMDQYEMKNTYILLPVSPKVIVGSKFIFMNSCFLSLSCISEIYLWVMSQYYIPNFDFSIALQCAWVSVAFIMTNLTIMGYYILGAANVQALGMIAMLVAMIGSKVFGTYLDSAWWIISPVAAVALSYLFFRISCNFLVADVFRNMAITRPFARKKK